AVVKIRRPQPQPIEGQIGIAVGLLEIAEPVLAAVNILKKCQLIITKLLSVTIEPRFIGAKGGIWLDLAESRSFEHIAVRSLGAVTGCAMRHVDLASCLNLLLIGTIGARRRMQVLEPTSNPFDRGVIDRLLGDSSAKRGAKVALLQGGIVAVPMELHHLLAARPLVEDRGEI